MESVVACVDFTHDPDGVALVAGALADRLDATLVLATVALPEVDAWFPVAGTAPLIAAPAATREPGDPGILQAIRDDVSRRLSHLAAAHDLHPFQQCVRFAVDAADALRRIADEEDAALLVVGATRHRAIGAAILGSTSHAPCADAPCPVVVVPSRLGASGDGAA
jgi:nucleotide-binding universal stress UspA family protein